MLLQGSVVPTTTNQGVTNESIQKVVTNALYSLGKSVFGLGGVMEGASQEALRRLLAKPWFGLKGYGIFLKGQELYLLSPLDFLKHRFTSFRFKAALYRLVFPRVFIGTSVNKRTSR